MLQAFLCIRERTRRQNKILRETLAKFKDGKGVTRFFTNAIMTKHLQVSTTKAYDIKSKAALSLFSPHSIRVGACV